MTLENNNNSSIILEKAINEIAKLPGIGRKTATRLVLHIIKQEKNEIKSLSSSINNLADEIKYCKSCHNISDTDYCSICSSSRRDKAIICVVENIKDIIHIEKTNQYNGVYHVLNGLISPIEGIGPSDLTINSLEEKICSGNINEIIFALSTTMEGDTTNFYIFKRLSKYNIKFSVLARGISLGDEIEYADEITLGRSIINRTEFEVSFSK